MTTRNELQHVPRRMDPLVQSESFVPATYVPAGLPGERGIPWREGARILRKHWLVSLCFAAGLEALLLVIVLMLSTTYESKTMIEIEPPSAPQISVSDTVAPSSPQQDYIDTQLEILRGDHLALVVIRDLHLDQNPTFMHRSWAGRAISKVMAMFSPRGGAGGDVEALIRKFQEGLVVDQVKSSRLVEVGYESTDAKLATAIATDVVDQYLQELHRSKYDATLRAAKSVSPELDDLKNSVTKADQSLIDFQKTHEGVALATGGGVAGDGTTASGSDTNGNPIAVRAAQLNQQLTAAMGDRLQQESYMKLIASGANDSLPQMKDSSLIQDLTKQAVAARADLAQLLAIYGGNNPQVRKAQEQVESLNSQLNAERNRIVSQIKASYQSAVNKENLTRSALNALKGQLDASNADSVHYDVLRRQAQANSNLYITLSSKIKEMAVSGTLSANNVRVLEEPRQPVEPSGPHRFRILGAGLLLSLIGGLVMAFVAEGMDDTISTLDDVKRLSGAPALALVPESNSPTARLHSARSSFHFLGNGRQPAGSGPILQFVTDRPHSPEAEAIRSLETAIRLQSQPPNSKIKVITVTSAFPGEGKTTLAVNLALALAKHSKVCLLDADIRHPRITECYGLGKESGLQDYLSNGHAKEPSLKASQQVQNLTIIGAGKPILQPLEAVTSKQMIDLIDSLRERFDYILLDAPPVIPFADSRWFAALSDGVVLVARSSTTTKKGLMWGMEILEEIHAPVLGIVLNGVDLQSEYYSYGTPKYHYQHA
jgi:succinoglycan biosynthesis transport protein ExoP